MQKVTDREVNEEAHPMTTRQLQKAQQLMKEGEIARENQRKANALLEHEALKKALACKFTALADPLDAVVGQFATLIHAWNEHQGFWDEDNTGEKFALMHSELSEGLEADRKDLPSDKIEGFTGVEEELADCVIRILDFAGYHGLRLGEALFAKLQYNLDRPYMHGKRY